MITTAKRNKSSVNPYMPFVKFARRSAAFPDREAWILRHRRDGNLGTRISETIDVHRRWANGKWVADEELARARHDLVDAQQLAAILAPTIGLSFSRRET